MRLSGRDASLTRISAYQLRGTWQTGRSSQWQASWAVHTLTETYTTTRTRTVNKPWKTWVSVCIKISRLGSTSPERKKKTIVPLWGGELRLICTCSSATSRHMPASLKTTESEKEARTQDFQIAYEQTVPPWRMTSACVAVLTACVTEAMIRPHR